MGKDSKKKEKPTESPFKKFVKKRAPIYLGIIALFIVFIVPMLTQSELEDTFPEDFTEKEKQILDTLMYYKGTNGKGLSVIEAIDNKIKEEYPDEQIYDNKKTSVGITITEIDSQVYQILFNFESHKGEINYSWNVNPNTVDISGNDSPSKHIIDLVEFYD